MGRRRGGRPSLETLLVVRILIVSNGLVLTAIGVLYLVYGTQTGGAVAGGVLLAVAVGLFCCVPYTAPYRRRR